MIVLGIETSCDDTSVAIVDTQRATGQHILALQTHHQTQEHQPYQGVVPEIAARSHLSCLSTLIQDAMKEAETSWAQLDGIAATVGPGLMGGLIVGSTMAKTLAMIHDKRFWGVHHLEAHWLTVRLTSDVTFPFAGLLVSGGHTQLAVCHGPGHYDILGETRDDALGECFDKVAKMAGLGYPGGPLVEALAEQGRTGKFSLPRPMIHKKDCLDFSFSGLKTAVRDALSTAKDTQTRADLMADFQHCVGDILSCRVEGALKKIHDIPIKSFVLTGGVGSNRFLRQRIQDTVESYGLLYAAPPLHLCTDNAAMVAWAGAEHMRKGHTHTLDQPLRPRWPLEAIKNPLSKIAKL